MANQTVEPKYVAQTLAWCNRHRKKKGLAPLKKLPKGVRCDPYSCPCSVATGLVVGLEMWRYQNQPIRWRKLPPGPAQFTINFDQGNLPQYVKGRKPVEPWVQVK